MADRAGIFDKIPGVDHTATALRRMIQRISRRQIPEQPIAAAMEKEASESGVTINIRELIDEILVPLTKKTKTQGSREAVRIFTSPTKSRIISPAVEGSSRRISRTKAGALKKLGAKEKVSESVQELINNIDEVLTLEGSDTRAVSISTAVEIKRSLQRLMRDRKAIRGAPTQTGMKGAESVTQVDDIISGFQAVLRKRISSEMDHVTFGGIEGAGSRTYSQVMSDFDRKMKQLSLWKLHLGAGLGDEAGRQQASTFIRNLHGSTKGGFRDAANSLQATTGVDIMKHAERAMVSELFGESGVAAMFPRISAVGEPVGTGLGKKALVLGTGGLAGLALGGPALGLAGMAVGGTVASEAGQLALRRGAPAIGRAAFNLGRGAVDRLGRSTNAKTLTAIQSLARQRPHAEHEPVAPVPVRRTKVTKRKVMLKKLAGASGK